MGCFNPYQPPKFIPVVQFDVHPKHEAHLIHCSSQDIRYLNSHELEFIGTISNIGKYGFDKKLASSDSYFSPYETGIEESRYSTS